MRKSAYLLVMTIWLTLSCLAQGGGDLPQPGPGGGGMLESAHIGYITQRLNLSPVEAQRFWPIYNQYAAEMRQARVNYRINKDELAFDEARLVIKKKYSLEFGRALSPARANQFFIIENDFAAFVQREWIQRKQLRMQQRRGGRINGPYK
ncbi:MAG: hypothetical protein Q8927_01740 [Bacteroidota bacterium]|nr:hypothetical protein [Bacteroidota bacterium]MDP4214893.1 hypothetical protein [Bacteroidota bacterium]MDP4247355.1 hypothetical protein [Bacteroidota bacterium]MDP4252385.1 hypothetical protein [Bacteroidota bacterium]MDP4257942.1 hypothetical protein [Bacteroidota bacterium]